MILKDSGAPLRESVLAPLATPDIRLAVGEANGRISILSFEKQSGEERVAIDEDNEEDEGDSGVVRCTVG